MLGWAAYREGEPTMKNHRVASSTILLVLFLGILTPQSAQNVPTQPHKPDFERHSQAVWLLRVINTAEVGERGEHGSYAPWQTLFAHQQEYLSKNERQNGVQFKDTAEVLPGWSLRLNVTADGQRYDVMLQGVATKQSSYSTYTNETGIIWEATPIQ